MNELIDRMRRDWDARAAEDAKYYLTCQLRNQDDEAFFQGAADVLARIRRDYPYLLTPIVCERRFLEIGCGIGRLMLWLAADCGGIHGVDISPAMIAEGRKRLFHIPHANFHVTENNDLAAFPDASFDLVYSFAVFQHVPDRTLVYRYVDEAFRVLKPAGLFTAQFNGAPPIEQRCDTWVGVWIAEAELLGYAKDKGWQVLSSEGADTQYLWVTMRRPLKNAPPRGDSLAITIESVMNPSGAAELVAGGPHGFATIYVLDLPDAYTNLNELSVRLGNQCAPIRYIGPMQPGSRRQINVQIPETTPSGAHPLAFYRRDRRISNGFDVVVRPCPPRYPAW